MSDEDQNHRTKTRISLVPYYFSIYWQNIAGFKNQVVDWWFNSTKQLRIISSISQAEGILVLDY